MTMPNTSPAPTPGRQRTARDHFREIKDEAVGQTKDSVRQARDRAASSLGESKDRFADQASNLARAFHQTSDRLRTENQARAADLTDTLAQQVDQVAAYLRDHDGQAMRQDLERLVRRQPGIFIGGAFAAGLLAARFFKSSDQTPTSARAPAGAGGPYAGD